MANSVRILGPVEVWTDGQPVALGGPQQLALFASLVLHADRAVSADVLIDTLWGDERGVHKRLQMAIARLRRTLAAIDRPGAIEVQTVGGGYLLALGDADVDAAVFEAGVAAGQRALQSGDPARAQQVLAEALGLWRGPPLAQLGFHDFAQPEIRRLEDLRLIALEDRIQADLELGRHSQLTTELSALVLAHPEREALTGQLMLALYRSGRPADALRRVRSYPASPRCRARASAWPRIGRTAEGHPQPRPATGRRGVAGRRRQRTDRWPPTPR